MFACFDACLVAFTRVNRFSVMMLDGKMFYFVTVATIRQVLEMTKSVK
jgi:hypothetical protein